MATMMYTTTVRDWYGQRVSEVTVCGGSVVVERFDGSLLVADESGRVRSSGEPGCVRGGAVVGGARIYAKVHDGEEAARADYLAQIISERAYAASL